MVAVRAVKRDVLTGCQVGVTVVLVAGRAESGSAKCAFGHYLLPPRRLAISIGNTGYPDKIPAPPESQPRFACISVLLCLPCGERPPCTPRPREGFAPP